MRIQRFLNVISVGMLTAAVSLSAEPVPQNIQEQAQTQPSREQTAASPNSGELPDAPTPAQPDPPRQGDPSQTENPGSVPSGAAGAKAAHAKGAPAARPMGAAIAPAKQRGSRSLLIKVGLVAGACVAVGSVLALSKGSPAKPAGAP
jgi:hypothetical protein